jgi:hypothetical protein
VYPAPTIATSAEMFPGSSGRCFGSPTCCHQWDTLPLIILDSSASSSLTLNDIDFATT